jgi:hypothetical protein
MEHRMEGTRKLRWLALALLGTGGACGEPANDEAQGELRADASASTEPDVEAGDEPGDDQQAAADSGDTDSGSTQVDARLEQTSLEFCRRAFECDATMAAGQLESEALCPGLIEGFVRDGVELDGEACGTAQLDSYECYAAAACDEQFSACEEQADRELEACPRSLGAQ